MSLQGNHLEYISLKPYSSLKDLVESIWMVKNHSDQKTEGIIVPDGKIDLFLFVSKNEPFEIFISGICSHPVPKPPFPKSTMFAISFYPLAAEYIFGHSFSTLQDTRQMLPIDYWGFSKEDLTDFQCFYQKACNIVSSQYSKEIDRRKKKVFEFIYESKGEITVSKLALLSSWSSRQMNRYFHNWFGITLKSYLNIIRFSNSLQQLKNGHLYPELNYGDQSHFIRDVKKFSGVRPTLLSKNENDRFIQLSLMKRN